MTNDCVLKLYLLTIIILVLICGIKCNIIANQNQCYVTCDGTGTQCKGYGLVKKSTTCPTATTTTTTASSANGTTPAPENADPYCYFSSYCLTIFDKDEYIKLTMNNINPQQATNQYASVIQNTVKNAYNTWCTTGDNYKLCCPGSIGWTTPSNNVTAMQSASEVQIAGALGSEKHTIMLLFLQPMRDSSLCNIVNYPTTVAAPTTTTTTTTTSNPNVTTTAAVNSNTTTTAAANSNATTTATANATTTTTNTATSGTATTPVGRKRRHALEKTALARKKRSTSLITLQVSTITALLVSVNISLTTNIVSAVLTASSGAVNITMTIVQNYASANTQAPREGMSAWVISVGTIGGLLGLGGLIIVILLITKNENRSAKVGDQMLLY